MNKKNEELILYAKRSLKKNLENYLLKISRHIDKIKMEPENWDHKSTLVTQNSFYQLTFKEYKQKYGVEFPDVEEKYQELIPKIEGALD